MSDMNVLVNKPYLIDAIIGNSSFLASLGSNGRMYRAWWPNIDAPQHVDAIRTGLMIDGQSAVAWFDDQNSWSHEAAYVNRSNTFRVQAKSKGQPIAVDSLHFAVPDMDLIVREYTFTNTSKEPVSFSFVQHSSFPISENHLYNTTMFQSSDDALLHFRGQYYFALSSANVCAKFHCGITLDEAVKGPVALGGKVIEMQPTGAMSWRMEGLAAGESVVIPVYIAAGHNEEQALEVLRAAKAKSSAAWADETNAFWGRFLDDAKPCPLPDETIRELYERSLLMFKLMSDEKSGAIIAAPEFDELFTRCGGYSYCWGRDAAFITTALDKAGLEQLSDHFYDWTLTAQSPDGSWQQRHYHDGSLAPSWGLQIDEGASIIWGMYEHYLNAENVNETGAEFAAKVWPAVSKGAAFLMEFLDEESGLPKPSMDLWEEREASHTYSSAAVYGGLSAAAKFAALAGEAVLAAEWSAAAKRISDAIPSLCWNEEKGSLYRGVNLTVAADKFEQASAAGSEGQIIELNKGYRKHVLKYDPIVDISMLGVAVPFAAVPAENDKMRRTADAVEALLTSPAVGGIKRYEDDPYIGGNPWILTTLWLAQYRISIGELDAARKQLAWAIDHRTSTGLLPEQIDKTTGETAWVVPLTWSHAMFVLTVWQLAEAEGRA